MVHVCTVRNYVELYMIVHVHVIWMSTSCELYVHVHHNDVTYNVIHVIVK